MRQAGGLQLGSSREDKGTLTCSRELPEGPSGAPWPPVLLAAAEEPLAVQLVPVRARPQSLSRI